MNKQKYEKEHMQDIADKIAQKTEKEDFPAQMHRTLHLIKQHDLVGTMLKKAMQQGEFDNLEGAGKPLDLEGDPFEPDELHMVHKILKDNGYAPYWIELGKEIDGLKARLNREVDSFKQYTRMVFSEKRSRAALRRYELKKNDFYAGSWERLNEISRKILDYNLHCPVSHLSRTNFDVNDEMKSIVNDIEKFIDEIKR
ncbi:MAG: DnaJ family domain-containing protein [Syntrophomonadaceae bacterium]